MIQNSIICRSSKRLTFFERYKVKQTHPSLINLQLDKKYMQTVSFSYCLNARVQLDNISKQIHHDISLVTKINSGELNIT